MALVATFYNGCEIFLPAEPIVPGSATASQKYVTCLVELFRKVILVLYCLSVLSMNWLKSLDQCLSLLNFLPMIWKYTLKCYNTIQYNGKFALKNWQAHCQFNLAHKLKRTKMFKRKMKWEILKIKIVLNVKLTKIRKMNEVRTTKIKKKLKK